MKCSSQSAAALARTRGRHLQRGSVAVTLGLFLLVGVVLVESLALGFQFYMRRQMQNVADMAALAGAQALSGSSCTNAAAAASSNVALNGGSATLTVNCGTWNPAFTTPYHYQIQSNAATTNPNAVYVSVSAALPYVPAWMPVSTAFAEAIAIRNGTPVAVFSIASNLMTSQLGCVAACGAIANVNLSMFNFLRTLGLSLPSNLTIGGLYNLLATGAINGAGSGPLSFTYGQIVSAVGAASGLGSLASVLNISTSVANKPVQLVTVGSTTGLFTLDNAASASTGTATSVLSANLNVLDLVSAAVGIANRHNAIATALSAAGITATVNVVSPPSIGVGGVGASAYSAQVRVYANINSTTALSSALGNASYSNLGTLATPLLGLLAGTATINIPIEIDVAGAQATVTSLCTARDANNNDTATFNVSAPLLQACIGNFNQSAVQNGTSSCASTLSSATVLSLLGGAVKVNAGFSLPVLANTGSYTLAAGNTVVTGANNLALGTTIAGLMNALVTQLSASLLPGATGAMGSSTLNNTSLAGALLSATGSTLNLAAGTVNSGLALVNTLAAGQSASGAPNAPLLTLLKGTTTLVASLTASLNTFISSLLSSLLGSCGVLSTPQACLASQVAGSGTANGATVSNATLALIGALSNLLQPVFNQLGAALTTSLNALLGAKLGQANLTLTSLNCLGVDVRLVQ